MTQLIVSLNDGIVLNDIKKAIKLLRGVADVRVCRKESPMPKATRRAIEELKRGDTVTVNSMDEYLKLMDSL